MADYIQAENFVFKDQLVTVGSAKAGLLRKKAKPVTFPLSPEVKEAIKILKFERHKRLRKINFCLLILDSSQKNNFSL